MSKLQTSFEKTLSDLYTINWSETDGSDLKDILKTYFDDIPANRAEIKKLIIGCTSLNKFAKSITLTVLEAC